MLTKVWSQGRKHRWLATEQGLGQRSNAAHFSGATSEWAAISSEEASTAGSFHNRAPVGRLQCNQRPKRL